MKNKTSQKCTGIFYRKWRLNYSGFAKSFFSLCFFLLLSVSFAFSQNKIHVTGKVLSDENTPLAGVSINVKGSAAGATTDKEGSFSMDVPNSNSVLVISYVGFTTQDITIGSKTYFPVTLAPANSKLDEVVVIGYGTVKKSDLTGAVSSVSTEDLPKSATAAIDNMLSGKVAGLTVKLDNAQPGGGVSVLVRGAGSPGAGNEPLYVIDGFPVSNNSISPGSASRYATASSNPLNSINPNDIESIEVLKDASATAIYGARAANGVILINTKSGKKGVTTIEYSGSGSVQNAKNPFDFMNAKELMVAKNIIERERYLFTNKVAPYGNVDPTTVTPFVPVFSDSQIKDAGEGTNWFDLITRTGTVQEHNISLRSGTDRSKYMLSFNTYDQKGILKNLDFTRYTGRFNLDQKINSWLDFGVRSTISFIKKTNTQEGGINEAAGVIASAYQNPPYLPVKDQNGQYTINPERPTTANPVSFSEISDNTKEQRLLFNSFLEAHIIKNLSARVSFGVDNNSGKRQRYYPTSFLYGALVNGDAAINDIKEVTKLAEATLTYKNKILDELDFTALVGTSWQKFDLENFSASNTNFLTNLFLYNNLAAGASLRPGVSSGKSTEEYVSYFSRLMFSLKNKYLLTLTMRGDGSSRFGKNNQYGYFPSGALAWKISEEDFLKNNYTLSNLKLRLSYGQTGNANIGSSAFAYYSTGSNYAFGNQVNIGVYQSQLENPNLKWETTSEMNLGLDFGLFDNRITGAVELYKKNIKDILSSRALPSYLPIGSVAANIGETESKGVEITLNSRNLTKGDFTWNTDLTFGSFRDNWKKRNPEVILPVYIKDDAPLHSLYGYKTSGIVQIGESLPYLPNAIPGDLKILDINGVDANGKLTGAPDGKISDADITYLGSSQPGWSFGFNNSFSFKNVDLSIFFYGLVNRLLYNDNLRNNTVMENVRVNNGFKRFLTDVWSSQNPTGTLPSGLTRQYLGESDFYIEDASFIRLKNITLGYTFNTKPQISKIFKNLRIFADASNLLVISGYSGGGDPETDNIAAYPYPKTFTLGINCKF